MSMGNILMKSHSVKFKNNKFVFNMVWLQNVRYRDLTKASLNINYGIKLSNTEFAFCEKKYLKHTSLAMVVAQSLKTGIFITDKITTDTVAEQFWLCIFKDGKPVFNLKILDQDSNEVNISGDQLISKAKLSYLLSLYVKEYPLEIFADISSDLENYGINVKTKNMSLDSLVSSVPVEKMYQVKRVNNDLKILATVLGVICFSIFGYFLFFYVESPKVFEKPKVITHIKPEIIKKPKKIVIHKVKKLTPPPPENNIIEDLQLNSFDEILNVFEAFLAKVPIEISGWSLQSIDIANTGYVELVYSFSYGGDMLSAKNSAISWLKSISYYESSSVIITNNFRTMNIKVKLNKKALQILKNLKVDDIKSSLKQDLKDKVIASLQRKMLNFTLGGYQNLQGGYTKSSISLSNMDAFQFKKLKEIAEDYLNITMTSGCIKYQNGIPSFSFSGVIYA